MMQIFGSLSAICSNILAQSTPEVPAKATALITDDAVILGLLLVVLVTVGVCVVSYGFWQIWSTVSDFEDRYLNAGYALKEGTTVTITEPILENTYLYARETLRIEAGAHASLALSAHEAFIAGTVTGDGARTPVMLKQRAYPGVV